MATEVLLPRTEFHSSLTRTRIGGATTLKSALSAQRAPRHCLHNSNAPYHLSGSRDSGSRCEYERARRRDVRAWYLAFSLVRF